MPTLRFHPMPMFDKATSPLCAHALCPLPHPYTCLISHIGAHFQCSCSYAHRHTFIPTPCPLSFTYAY